MSEAVKPGYKQTEVGVIPEEWEVKPLSQVAEIRGGIAKNSNVVAIDPISVHYLRVANVQDGFLDLSEMSKIQISRHDLERYRVLPGDVLMNEGGDLDKLGRGAIWHDEFNPCVHQNHVFAVRCKAALLPDYLDLWTEACPARRFFLLTGKQTTNLASISKSSLGALSVAVPPLREQRAIAEVLSDVDALMGGLDRLIAKKRDLKQATMQQLLTGQTRLPGEWEVKPGYKQTEVGVIPADWGVTSLGSCLSARPDYGINAPAVPYSDKLPVYIRITDITEDGLFLSGKPVSVRSVDAGNYYLSEGDIVLARTGASVGKSYRYNLSDGPLVFAGFLIRVRPDTTKLLPAFAAAYFTTGSYWRWVSLMSMRSGQPGINSNE